MQQRNKGITLVALVITIIILLILAAITINMTIGQRGIITRAQQAGKNYQEAADREDKELAKLWDEAENILKGNTQGSGNTTGGGQDPVKPGEETEKPWEQDPTNPDWSKPSTNTEKDNYEDESGKKATIPEGFQVSKKEGETEIDDGLVIRDAITNNEFVWVPCSANGSNEQVKYNRYTLTKGAVTNGTHLATNSIMIKTSENDNSYYIEAMPTIKDDKTELDSITEYGGFYIGRYEVGIEGHDEKVDTTGKYGISWTGYSNGTAVIQKGKQVWNYITIEKAKEIVEEMYIGNEIVISKLCSSYAWDTALMFIRKNHSRYPSFSPEGNYYNSAFTYTDLEGNVKTKRVNSTVIVPTGQTTAVNNIYDMGGNISELTLEKNSEERASVVRGSSCDYQYNTDPAGDRDAGLYTSGKYIGFRCTLFLLK